MVIPLSNVFLLFSKMLEHFGLDVGDARLAEPMREAHRHFDIEFNFVLEGRMTLHNGQSEAVVRAGEACVFWAACLHRVVAVGAPERHVWATVPPARFLGWALPPGFTRRVLAGEVVVDATSPEWTGDAAAARRWLADRASGRPLEAAGFAAELESRARRFAQAGRVRAGRGHGGLSASPLPRAVEAMARAAAEDPSRTVDELARVAGLHPVYATALFRRHFGLGLKEHLARQRIAVAQKLLLTTRQSVLEVAYACGFATPGRFHAWFRRLLGQTPRDYRARGGGLR